MEIEIWQILLLLCAAFISGFIDAIAGGGGLITVPSLLAVGIPPHMALATNKLQSTFGSSTAAFFFYKKGFFKFLEVALGLIFTFIGAILGAISVLFINANFLNFIVPFLLALILIYTIFAPNLGEKQTNAKMKKSVFYLIFGLGLGFYDGFFGPGTGSFWTFAIIGLLGLAMKSAIAQTKAFNFASNLASLVVFIFSGQILWIVGLSMGVFQIIGSFVGAKFVIKKDVKLIRAFYLFMVTMILFSVVYKFFKTA